MCFVDGFLYVFFLDVVVLVWYLLVWIGDWCIGKGLVDDGDWDVVDVFYYERFEDWIVEIGGFDVLGDDIDMVGEIFFFDFFDVGFVDG